MKLGSSIMILALLLLAACSGGPANPDANSAPAAEFTATTANGPAPLAVDFDASASRDSDGTIVAYDWDFGDGATGTGTQISHTFTTAGTYDVYLTVTDNRGAKGSAVLKITAETPGGGPGGPPGGPGPGPGEPTDPEPAAQMAAVALQLGGDKRELQADASALALEAVVLASQLNSGVLTVTGTLTQSGASFTYSSTPTDRLLVNFQNGNSVEVIFAKLDGNLEASNPDAFLRAPHDIHFQVTRTIAGVTDFLIYASQRNNSNYQDRLSGEIVLDGVRWTLDLNGKGTYKNIVDVQIDYEYEENITGTVSGNGVSANVNEYYRYRYLLVDNAVENNERRINTTWTYSGDSYAAQNIHIRRAYNNGVPAEFDYWIAGGQLFQNGALIATVGSSVTDVAIDIFLDWGGERYLIYRDVRP